MLNHATSKSESNTALHIQRQYIQAFQAAQSQQYAQICSAVQLNEYQQLQKFAERQRHLELEQIKAKEKTQESANASNAVKRRLQEVLLARQLRPSNESVSNVAIPCTIQGAISWQSGCAEFPLRKTVSEPNLKLRSRLKQKQERRNSPLMARKSPGNEVLTERIRRKISTNSMESNPRDSPPCGHRPSSISSLNQRDPRDPGPSGFVPRTGQQQNSIFSSPSLPNIAQAVRNNEDVKSNSPMRTHHESDSQIGSQRNQLLVQALIANHLQGMQHQRFGSL
jgi:hypothetical protein